MDLLVHTLLSNALAATFMALIVAGLTWICRRPALRHSLWLLVMLKLITPPFVFVPFPVADLIPPIESSLARFRIDHGPELAVQIGPQPQLDAGASGRRDIDETSSSARQPLGRIGPDFAQAATPKRGELAINETPLSLGPSSGWSWESLVLFVILAGALGWWTLATTRIIRFQRLLKEVPPASGEWQLHTDDLAERVGLGWKPLIYLTPGRVPPMLWAIGGRPRLLVPSALWTKMEADERTSLLLHELAHLKRRDHWVRWLELVVVGLYWWHPVVWCARRALHEAEEQCCDAWVVWAMPKRARMYASALLAAVEFVSGAPTAPAVSSATSGSGDVSCLKRRLQMIVRAKTPKGHSQAGRFAVLGMAALVLPLAPSWAQKSAADQSIEERHEAPKNRAEMIGSGDRETIALKQQLAMEHLAHIRRDLLKVQSDKRKLEAHLKMQRMAESQEETSGHVTKSSGMEQELAMLIDLEKRLTQEIRSFAKESQSLTVNILAQKEIQDGERKGDNEEKLRDSAERFQEHLKNLLNKLGKELGPVAEEVRKSLEKAVGEIHKSLEKEGLSPEDLAKALEKSHDDLRKAFEGGGPVDKELREAIEKARKDMQETFDHARGDAQEQAEKLRERSLELRERAREDFRRGREEAEKAARGDHDAQSDRDELKSARREIRDLEQKLRSATRHLDELQRRESRRNPEGRRARNLQPEAQPREQTTPDVKPPAEPPRQPAIPATPSRPARQNMRRPVPPNRPVPGAGRRAPQTENDSRLREFEEKMNRLLKELESLKGEKSSTESKAPSPGSGRPTKESSPITS